jgi:hypothetical protein
VIAPPSGSVIYERLAGGNIRVKRIWLEGSGGAYEYDETGQMVLHTFLEAVSPRVERPGPEEWGMFRRLEHLTGCGSPVLIPSLRITNMNGVQTHIANGKHRVVSACRAGHSEIVEVRTERELIEAMIAACGVMLDGRVCGAVTPLSRHIGPDGVEISLIMIPDERTA